MVTVVLTPENKSLDVTTVTVVLTPEHKSEVAAVASAVLAIIYYFVS